MSVPGSLRRRLANLLAMAGVLSVTLPVLADDGFTPQAILSYQTYDTGALTSGGFHQTYDLRLEKALADPASLRLYLRAEDFQGTTKIDGTSYSSGSRQMQPGGEFFYTLPTIRWNSRFDIFNLTSATANADNTRRLTRVGTNFNWTPYHLPTLNVDGERRTSTDDASGLETQEDYATAGLSYAWPALQLGINGRYNQLTDGGAGFARRNLDQDVLANYEDSYFHGKMTASANALASRSQRDERAKGGPVRVPNPAPIPRVLYAIDDTPLEMRDHPLVAISGLNDNDLRTRTQIALGPESGSYQNLAFDFGRLADVDEVRIYIRDAAGDPLRTGGSLRWDVFTSDDGITWRPAPSGARSSFYIPLSYYLVEFPLMTTRWLKIVNFGTNIDPAWATETQAFYHTQLSASGSRRTDIALYSGMTTVSGQPWKWLNLTYSGLFNSSTQTPSDGAESATTDADHMGSVEVDPLRWLAVSARYEKRLAEQTGGLDQTFDGWTGLVSFRPTSELDLSFEAQRQNELLQGRTIETDANIVHGFARILPSLDLSFDAGTRTQDFVTEGTVATSRGVDFLSNAQLFRTFRVSTSASFQRTQFEGSGVVIIGLPPARDDRWYVEGEWRPGPPLTLAVRYGGVDTTRVSSVAQRYRVQWYPFAGGTVSIGATYEEDIDPYTNRQSTRAIFSPSWLINRHAIFDLNYTMMKTTGDMASETNSFYATLTLRR